MNFLFFLVNVLTMIGAVANEAKVGEVIKSIEAATQRQEVALKSTTQKLRALQERVNALLAN
jgi:hypothetical protein